MADDDRQAALNAIDLKGNIVLKEFGDTALLFRPQQLHGLLVRMHCNRLLRRPLGCTADQCPGKLHGNPQQHQHRDR